MLPMKKWLKLKNKKKLFVWSSASGVRTFESYQDSGKAEGEWADTELAEKAFSRIIATDLEKGDEGGFVFVFKDLQDFLQPNLCRLIRDHYKILQEDTKTIIIAPGAVTSS
jgi:hypothetical protein